MLLSEFVYLLQFFCKLRCELIPHIWVCEILPRPTPLQNLDTKLKKMSITSKIPEISKIPYKLKCLRIRYYTQYWDFRSIKWLVNMWTHKVHAPLKCWCMYIPLLHFNFFLSLCFSPLNKMKFFISFSCAPLIYVIHQKNICRKHCSVNLQWCKISYIVSTFLM